MSADRTVVLMNGWMLCLVALFGSVVFNVGHRADTGDIQVG